jgi:hypothetical protein
MKYASVNNFRPIEINTAGQLVFELLSWMLRLSKGVNHQVVLFKFGQNLSRVEVIQGIQLMVRFNLVGDMVCLLRRPAMASGY